MDLEVSEGGKGKEEEKGADKGKDNEKAQGKKKAPSLSMKYNSDDADISLISSDNFLFKVHSYRLMAAS
jgi:hypothetical protein